MPSALYRLKSDPNTIVIAEQFLPGVIYPLPEAIELGRQDRLYGPYVYLRYSATGIRPQPGDWIVGIKNYSQREPYSPGVFQFLFEKCPSESS